MTPYTSYLILEDERRRGVPLSRQTMRELGADRAASADAKATFDSAAHDSGRLEKDGQRAVANSANAQSLKQAESEQAAQQGFALEKRRDADPFAASPSAGAGGGPTAGAAAFRGPATQPAGYRFARNYAQQSRVVNGRAFYQNGTVWTDANAQAGGAMKQQTVVFNTEGYFDLLKQHPEATQWLALGDEVDVVLDDTLYSVRNASEKK